MLHFEAFGTTRLNQFMRGIYSNDVLMPSRTGIQLSDALYDFVKSFMYQASAAYKKGLNFFPMHPKLHSIHEVAYELRRQCRSADFCVNPAIHSCSLDEDFIGRCAVISRCVSPRLAAKRTLQRYLCHIQLAWARTWGERKHDGERGGGDWCERRIHKKVIGIKVLFLRL